MKLLLFLSLPFIVASLVMERLMGARRLRAAGKESVSVTAEDALERLLARQEIVSEVKVKRLGVSSPIEEGRVILSTKVAGAGDAAAVGRAVWLAGLARIETTTPQVLRWWRAARTFGLIGVPLCWLILVFAIFGTKLSAGMVFMLAVVVLGLSCGFCLLQLPMNLQAARYGISVLESSRLLHRMDEEEAVIACAKGHAWREALPLCIRLFMKEKRRDPATPKP